MNLFSIRQLGLWIAIGCVLTIAGAAQTDDSKKKDSQQQKEIIGIQLSDPIESVWEFGVKISCSGNGKQIAVVSPIPMDWPEQTVEIVTEIKTDNVGKLVHRNATKDARQFSFGVNQMMAGQNASAIVKMKIKKRFDHRSKRQNPIFNSQKGSIGFEDFPQAQSFDRVKR